MSYVFLAQDFVVNTNFGILLTVILNAIDWKYHQSGTENYKCISIEVGHFPQTLQLLAVSEKVQTWITGIMNEDIISEKSKIDLMKEFPAFYVGFGYSDFKEFNKTHKKALEVVRQAKDQQSHD